MCVCVCVRVRSKKLVCKKKATFDMQLHGYVPHTIHNAWELLKCCKKHNRLKGPEAKLDLHMIYNAWEVQSVVKRIYILKVLKSSSNILCILRYQHQEYIIYIICFFLHYL